MEGEKKNNRLTCFSNSCPRRDLHRFVFAPRALGSATGTDVFKQSAILFLQPPRQRKNKCPVKSMQPVANSNENHVRNRTSCASSDKRNNRCGIAIASTAERESRGRRRRDLGGRDAGEAFPAQSEKDVEEGGGGRRGVNRVTSLLRNRE